VTIDADVGELRSGIPKMLGALGAHVRVSQLRASDYLVGNDVGVERKSVLDLHFSIRDHRLWSQLRADRAALGRRYLVVEGGPLDDGSVSAAGIRGALLEIGDRGVTVIRTVDARDSALWILRIAVRAQRSGLSPRPRPRLYGRVAEPADIVVRIPGIGPSKARSLLARFGSIAGIASATREDLEQVQGIGPSLSRAIHDASTRT
jgi:DNA excision repair protein ERCC-4